MRAAEIQRSAQTLRFPRQNSLSGIRSSDIFLGPLLSFIRGKQGAISSPKLLRGCFPLWHLVPLRNLGGWTLHEIMQIKDRHPSPNRFSIWTIFSRVRCFQKAWGNSWSNMYQHWHWKHTRYLVNTNDATSWHLWGLNSSARTGHCTKKKTDHPCPKDLPLCKITKAKRRRKAFCTHNSYHRCPFF